MTGELLTGEDALKLYNNWDHLSPEELPRAQERLRDYRDTAAWDLAIQRRAAADGQYARWLDRHPNADEAAAKKALYHLLPASTRARVLDAFMPSAGSPSAPA